MWIFLSPVFLMSQLRNREAEKLCQGHSGRWRAAGWDRRYLRGGQGPSSGKRRPSRQDPPGQGETGRWPVRVAGRAAAKGFQEVAHLEHTVQSRGLAFGLAVLGRFCPASTAGLWLSPDSADGRAPLRAFAVFQSRKSELNDLARALGTKEKWTDSVAFLLEAREFKDPPSGGTFLEPKENASFLRPARCGLQGLSHRLSYLGFPNRRHTEAEL